MPHMIINKREVVPLFSKVFYLNTLDINFKKIHKLLGDDFIKAGFRLPEEVKNVASFTTSKNILEEPKFKFLKKIIMKELYVYTKEVLRYNHEFKMTTSWFTKTEKGEESNYHNHRNSYISCVLYTNVDDKSGDISFTNYKDDKMFQLTPFEYNNFNSESIRIRPQNGMIIFCPSEVHHKIITSESDISRHSLACNFIPIGDIGDSSSDSYVQITVK